MTSSSPASAGTLQRSCAVIAAALSDGRRDDARLVTGERRAFSTDITLRTVNVPYPYLSRDWDVRTVTCGIALQCAPSKDRLATFAVEDLLVTEVQALAVIEGRVALGWVAETWPGLLPEFERLLGELHPLAPDLHDDGMLEATALLAESRPDL